jgi:D-beta-D-heptose 7-phosphate kinase/D-beta-D-heptose 1-phosphate adenosyltransferase
MFLHSFNNKIMTLQQAQSLALAHKMKGKKVIFTNGCFDIIHVGHIHTLASARALGACLIVGLNSDASVKKLKGDTRPLQTQDDRALILAALSVIDAIILFEDATPIELIKTLVPDVLVKGGDYEIESIVGYDVAHQTVVIPFVDGHSSSMLMDKLKSL